MATQIKLLDKDGALYTLHGEVDPVSGYLTVKHAKADGVATDSKLDELLARLNVQTGRAQEIAQVLTNPSGSVPGSLSVHTPWATSPIGSAAAAGKYKLLQRIQIIFWAFGGTLTWADDDKVDVVIKSNGTADYVYQATKRYREIVDSGCVMEVALDPAMRAVTMASTMSATVSVRRGSGGALTAGQLTITATATYYLAEA